MTSRPRSCLDGGATDSLPSTIVDLTSAAHPAILREGAISSAEVSEVLGISLPRGVPHRNPIAPATAHVHDEAGTSAAAFGTTVIARATFRWYPPDSGSLERHHIFPAGGIDIVLPQGMKRLDEHSALPADDQAVSHLAGHHVAG